MSMHYHCHHHPSVPVRLLLASQGSCSTKVHPCVSVQEPQCCQKKKHMGAVLSCRI